MSYVWFNITQSILIIFVYLFKVFVCTYWTLMNRKPYIKIFHHHRGTHIWKKWSFSCENTVPKCCSILIRPHLNIWNRWFRWVKVWTNQRWTVQRFFETVKIEDLAPRCPGCEGKQLFVFDRLVSVARVCTTLVLFACCLCLRFGLGNAMA